ncbi:MAG TPA: phytoene/squalene synthase family protein [Candidatus Limnocylindria bacterium]|nr:phytoene/squalene synthase family protein [Candidatus Limnocylindria bacterium]
MTPELQKLLRDTSRSFYLTLQVLPRSVRPQIGLAYLLARATDTIADTELVHVTERLWALKRLKDRILGQQVESLDFSKLAEAQQGRGSAGERRLLQRVEIAVAQLDTFTVPDRQLIREVLTTITAGQELDLAVFGVSPPPPLPPPFFVPPLPDESGMPPVITSVATAPPVQSIFTPPARTVSLTALATDAELDDYTYRVAGCVGEFWTKITRAHVFPSASLDEAQFLADGIRFGKGLQLVNILRDLPKDLRAGRCYVPATRLAEFGLTPQDLLDPANHPRFRPLYAELLDRAQGHLEAGWCYTNTIPRHQWRLRLACAWPVLIGVRTIAKLCDTNVLDARRRVKVARPQVQRMLASSVLRLPFRGAWERQFGQASS